MKVSQPTMGMPATVEIINANAAYGIEAVFDYFSYVNELFSPYRTSSEVSRVNAGTLAMDEVSDEFLEVLALAEQTKKESGGFFNILCPDGTIDPSGIVKGWAIQKAAELLTSLEYENFYIDVGGDVAVRGVNAQGNPWSLGIRSPFNFNEIVKVVYAKNAGVATSGTQARGNHIYNPHNPSKEIQDVASITVVGPHIQDADRYATSAFAMGKQGIHFIESLPGFEGYLIDPSGVATMTSGFPALTHV